MVKAYLRYEEAAAFGVVVSPDANIDYDNSGKLLLAGALEQLVVWNVKQGRSVHTLSLPNASGLGGKSSITSVLRMPSSQSLVAVGYNDGTVRIWDIVTGTCETTLVGHRTATTALRCNRSGSLLASGSKDTDIIVWDVVGEAGLYSLRGHKDQITDVVFLEKNKRLISCSKDTSVRVWDLDMQSCIQIVVGHRGDIWSLDVDPLERYLVSGSADPVLHVFTILENTDGNESAAPLQDTDVLANGSSVGKGKWDVLKLLGSIKRNSSDRVVTVRFNLSGTLLGCQVAGKTIEIYRVADESEAMKRLKRRKKRKREKASLTKVVKPENGIVGEVLRPKDGEIVRNDEIGASDKFQLIQTIRVKQKIRSFRFSPLPPKKGTLATLALSLHNNSIEVHDLLEESSSRVYAVELQGHRSDVRVAILSQDDTLLMTSSHDAVKIWNPQTRACLHTVESGYGLSGVFVPGNNHAIIGTKAGKLEIVDIRASERSEAVEAHLGAVWSISPMADGSGFVSGSADHDVRFWEYDVQATKRLSIRNTRTLRMADDVLSVRLSPDSKYLAVALLDSTIKVFFVDSLKFFLSLYGHKLPVLGMDISSDGALLATGSADKNMKIWGMDFGDCHKSLFAHADSVMAVQFVPKTHYVFSVGKDCCVKYWNADTFELLLTLEGHHAEVWCMAVSTHGDFLVTGSHDRSIRRWDRTQEPFFIEEEREKRLEAMFDADLGDSRDGLSKDEVPDEGAAGVAGKKTQDSLAAVDSIMEALEMAESEAARILVHKKEKESNEKIAAFKPNVLLLGKSPTDFVLKAVSSVRPSDLEQALLMLPFMDALKLIGVLKIWITEGKQVELACRVAVLLLRIHHQQLSSTMSARLTLTELNSALKLGVQCLKDTIGFNLAAVGHLQSQLAARGNMAFKDAGAKLVEIKGKLAKRKGAPDQGSKKHRKHQKV